jgi:surface antigen
MQISQRRIAPLRTAALGIIGITLLAVGASAARLTATAGARSHRSRHHHLHAQALSGSLKGAHVKVVEVTLTGGRGGSGDPGDDYPSALKNRPQDSVLDQWREYNRECTSFVAWALSSRNGFTLPFFDNAYKWGPRASALHFAVNSTPAPGSVAWSSAGSLGHVAYVERVSGSSVYIEEYNHDPRHPGTYDSRTVPSSTFTGYIHFADQAAAPVPAPAPPPTPVPSTPPTEGGTPTTTTPPAPPPPATHAEQETPNHPVNTFTNYHNASGQGPAIGSGAWVQVSCKVYDPAIASVNPDGYWYRIASAPWNNAYYSPANTFMNGDPYGGPYTHNTDFAVPNC